MKKIKLFLFLLLIATLISINYKIWFNLILIFISISLLELPKYLKISNIDKFSNKLKTILLSFVYISIFFEIFFSSLKDLFWIKVLFYFIISFIIGILGFSLIYILNRSKSQVLKLNPLFMALFSFCFTVTTVTLFETFKHILNYFFNINISNFNTSDSLGFLVINIFGAGLISILGYIYLKLDEDKNFIKKFFNFKSFKKNIENIEKKEIYKLIKNGESESLEFKESLRYNLNTSKFDKVIYHSSLKTICAFLNTNGGILLIGINDDGNIMGIHPDGFKNNDKFLLFFNNLIKKYIGEQFIPYINYEIIKINNTSQKNSIKSILKVKCTASNKEVFLKDGHIEQFYIRVGPASILIEGSKLIEYIQRKFKI